MTLAGQGAALEALRQAALVADVDAWRAHLPGGLVGAFARRRVRRALRAAATRLGADLGLEPHTSLDLTGEPDPVAARVALLHAAWLIAAGRRSEVPEASVAAALGSGSGDTTRAAIAAAFWAAQNQPRGSRRPLYLTLGALALVVLAVVLFTRSSPPPNAPSTHTGHLAAEAESRWVEDLTEWVVALDRLGRMSASGALPSQLREMAEHVDALQDAILAAPLPPHVHEAAAGALKIAREVATGDDWDRREEALAQAVRVWNSALREARLGYFLDAYSALYPGRGEVGLFVFRVEAIARYRPDGGPTDALPMRDAAGPLVDALHLRRLDSLNLVQHLLGYTSPRMDVAVVLLDKIEHHLATRLGPALVSHGAMPLSLEGEPFESWDLVRSRAGQLVREAFNAAFPGERQALTSLGELLAQRDALFAEWNERLARRGITLRVPERLELPSGFLDEVTRLLGRQASDTLSELQDRLTRPDHRALFERLLLRHAASVERHEVQHRLDYAAPDFAPPPALITLMGVRDLQNETVARQVDRTSAELSAYTAELARDPQWLMVNLALLVENLYSGSGGAEAWSAALILDGLAELSGIYSRADAPARLLEVLPLENARVAALHLELMAQPPAALAKSAAGLWQRWYGRSLVPIAREEAAP